MFKTCKVSYLAVHINQIVRLLLSYK